VNEQLATSMKVRRAMLDLTQADLAERTGITRKSVNAIETGKMVPSVILALKLAKALGVPVEALFSID
jgi:putative transcriptional regulator